MSSSRSSDSGVSGKSSGGNAKDETIPLIFNANPKSYGSLIMYHLMKNIPSPNVKVCLLRNF